MVAAGVLAGCTASHHHTGPTRSVAPPAIGGGGDTPARLAKLRTLLPSGFSAPGTASSDQPEPDLNVAPAAGFQASDVHLIPTPPKSQLRGVLAVVLNIPVPITARGLYASSDTLAAGQQITISAAELSPGTHSVLIILQGPGYRGEHLVQAEQRVTAGVVTMPAHLAPGTWYIAVEDQEGITTNSSGGVTGSALVDIGQFTVS